MKLRLLSLCLSWFVVFQTAASDKWVPLFDGETLNGWEQKGGKAKYRIEDGQIIGGTVTNEPNSFLCTTRSYTNFVLELEFKVDQGLNSGVQVRSLALDQPTQFEWKGKQVKVPARRVHGLQVEIDPGDRAWTGGVHEEGARGWLNDLKANEPARKAFKRGEWNTLKIECNGDSIRTWINGVAAADFTDSRTPAGFIALQVHGVGKNPKPMEVRFRDIKIREL